MFKFINIVFKTKDLCITSCSKIPKNSKKLYWLFFLIFLPFTAFAEKKTGPNYSLFDRPKASSTAKPSKVRCSSFFPGIQMVDVRTFHESEANLIFNGLKEREQEIFEQSSIDAVSFLLIHRPESNIRLNAIYLTHYLKLLLDHYKPQNTSKGLRLVEPTVFILKRSVEMDSDVQTALGVTSALGENVASLEARRNRDTIELFAQATRKLDELEGNEFSEIADLQATLENLLLLDNKVSTIQIEITGPKDLRRWLRAQMIHTFNMPLLLTH